MKGQDWGLFRRNREDERKALKGREQEAKRLSGSATRFNYRFGINQPDAK